MCAPYILCTFDIILGMLNLETLLSLHHLCGAYIVYLCVICYSNRFNFFIFKLCIMISHIEDVHRLRRSRAEFGLVIN